MNGGANGPVLDAPIPKSFYPMFKDGKNDAIIDFSPMTCERVSESKTKRLLDVEEFHFLHCMICSLNEVNTGYTIHLIRNCDVQL